MQIRLATPADADAIAHIHALSWRSAYRGALSDAYLSGPIEAERGAVWRERFARPDAQQYVAVAESDGRVVGFVCAYGGHDAQWGTFIDNLHVLPDLKRAGIGRQMMREAATWAERMHPGQGMYLWVLESNAPARAFYERIGGAQVEHGTWTPPDGSALPKLRYAWRDFSALLGT